jgi:hypothetical protein
MHRDSAPGSHGLPGVTPPGFLTPFFTAMFVFLLPATSFGVC